MPIDSTPAEAIWGRDALILTEQINAPVSPSRRSNVLQQFLLRKLSRRSKEPIDGLVRAFWSHKGQSRVSTVCRELGVTERRLERMFATGLGVSPKQFARLARFLHACHLMRHRRTTTLAQMAQDAGYYDQAHCIAEFKAFAGMTPRAFMADPNVAFLEVD